MKGFSISGHVAIDEVITENTRSFQIGGPPCFAASLGSKMGFKVDAVTKIGYDFPEEHEKELVRLGVKSEKVAGFPSTRFLLDYRSSPRVMRVPSVCEPFEVLDLVDAHRLLVCPIVSEINDETLLGLEPDFLALDPQGLLREVGSDKIVRSKRWMNREVLEKLDLLKTNSSEHKLITGRENIQESLEYFNKIGVETAIITDGENGAYLRSSEGFLHIPVYKVEAVDSTGAGDVFMAGFAAFLDEGPKWASAVASAASSAVTETHGVNILATKNEIISRAEYVYEKIT